MDQQQLFDGFEVLEGTRGQHDRVRPFRKPTRTRLASCMNHLRSEESDGEVTTNDHVVGQHRPCVNETTCPEHDVLVATCQVGGYTFGVTPNTRYQRYLLVLVLALTACASDSKQRVLKATLTGLNTARSGFLAWDSLHQNEIVRDADNFKQARERLDQYRKDRSQIVTAFEIAYQTLALAALEPKMEHITEALEAAKRLYDLVLKLQKQRVK